MAVPAHQMIEIIQELASPDPRIRESAADRMTDWLGNYSPGDGKTLAGLLSLAAACEQDHVALEAELNALLALGTRGYTDLSTLQRLRDIEVETLPPELQEYVEDLLSVN
ncbi:hypothetical protein ABTX77_34555 [Streptomyces sp. NPDC097704]|uniref:hypothetical protein n=1 Tax=Streptomyces sp. NPDC097704 TaxID=3157101 RepID=UPI003329D654